MKGKGVYPYEYITSLLILKENQLPLQEKFYSSLENKHVTDEQYKRAEEVWKKFKMKTLWNYHDLYLIMDIRTTKLTNTVQIDQKCRPTKTDIPKQQCTPRYEKR